MTDVLDSLEQPHVQLLLRLTLGGLLLLSAVTKLADRQGFRQAVSEYQLLPAGAERPFAELLPWLELSLGALLLVGLATAAAAALAVPLFLSFGAAIAVNMWRGRDIDCHCFGAVQSDPIGWPSLFRSVALVLVALVVALGASAFGALDAAVFDARGLPPASEVVPVVLLAFVIFDVVFLLPEAVNTQISFSSAYGRGHRAHAHEQQGGPS